MISDWLNCIFFIYSGFSFKTFFDVEKPIWAPKHLLMFLQVKIFCLINDFSWNYKNKNVSSTGKAFWLHIFLKVVSTTFGPITMFKQHSLSFHVVSKKFTTQNYLVFNPSNILCFSCFYLTCFALSCAFSTQR